MIFDNLPRFKKKQFQIMEMIPKWAALYGVRTADIENQIMTAHVWYDSNPTRAPKSDVLRGLNNWMKIAKEFGHFAVKPNPVKPYVEPRPESEDEIMEASDWARMKEAIRRPQ